MSLSNSRLGAVVVVLGLLVAACSHSAELEVLRLEPILEPMPGAVELARSETAGERWLFEVAPRVEVLWGVPGDIEEAADFYLEKHGDDYRLRRRGNDFHWSGRRSGDEFGLSASVRFYGSLAEADWSPLRIDETAVITDWEGTVVMVRVSTSG